MKFAFVLTKWIGTGTVDDKQRADLPQGYSRMAVLGDQFINLKANCPDPNLAVVIVEESREKHKGYIAALKPKINQVVIEEWEDDAPFVRVASPAKLKGLLVRQGMDEGLADDLTSAPDDVSIVGPLITELEQLDKRARRRYELERGG